MIQNYSPERKDAVKKKYLKCYLVPRHTVVSLPKIFWSRKEYLNGFRIGTFLTYTVAPECEEKTASVNGVFWVIKGVPKGLGASRERRERRQQSCRSDRRSREDNACCLFKSRRIKIVAKWRTKSFSYPMVLMLWMLWNKKHLEDFVQQKRHLFYRWYVWKPLRKVSA